MSVSLHRFGCWRFKLLRVVPLDLGQRPSSLLLRDLVQPRVRVDVVLVVIRENLVLLQLGALAEERVCALGDGDVVSECALSNGTGEPPPPPPLPHAYLLLERDSASPFTLGLLIVHVH